MVIGAAPSLPVVSPITITTLDATFGRATKQNEQTCLNIPFSQISP